MGLSRAPTESPLYQCLHNRSYLPLKSLFKKCLCQIIRVNLYHRGIKEHELFPSCLLALAILLGTFLEYLIILFIQSGQLAVIFIVFQRVATTPDSHLFYQSDLPISSPSPISFWSLMDNQKGEQTGFPPSRAHLLHTLPPHRAYHLTNQPTACRTLSGPCSKPSREGCFH